MKSSKRKYGLGTGRRTTVNNYMQSPSDVLAKDAIDKVKAQAEAQDNPLAMAVQIAGVLGANLASSGAFTSEDKSGTEFGQFATKFLANGGTAEGVAEVEGQEVVETPQGLISKISGPSHENGGVDVVLPSGTEVYSKRIKKFGDSMAERKLARENRRKNINKSLEKNPQDKALINAHARTIENLDREEAEDLKTQEQFGTLNAIQHFMYGTDENGTPIYTLGTGEGLPFLPQETVNYLKQLEALGKVNQVMTRMKNANSAMESYEDPGVLDNLISKTEADTNNLISNQGTSKFPMPPIGTEAPEAPSPFEDNTISSLPLVDTFAKPPIDMADPEAPASLPVNENFDTNAFDINQGKLITEAGEDSALSLPIDSNDESGERKTGVPATGKATVGDYISIAGDLFSTFAPLQNTLNNRAGDTVNENMFAEFGKDALEENLRAMELAAVGRDNQLTKNQNSSNAAKRRNRNSARGVNTMRALDTSVDVATNQANNDANAYYTNTLMQLFGQRAGLQNAQDSAVMHGAATADLANRQDRDNFYTQKAKDLATMGQGIQTVGKDLNAIEQNKQIMNILNELSKYGIAFDKNGKLIQKPE